MISLFPVLRRRLETEINKLLIKAIERPRSRLSNFPVRGRSLEADIIAVASKIGRSHELYFNTLPVKRGRLPELYDNAIAGTRAESRTRD